MIGKELTPEQKDSVLAMLRAGKSYREIRNALTISIGSVHNIARQAENTDLTRMVKEIKRGYAARYLMFAEYLMEELPSHINERTNVKDIAVAAAILTDKALKFEKAEQTERKLERKLDSRLDKLLGPLPEMIRENEHPEQGLDGISFMDSGRYEDIGPKG